MQLSYPRKATPLVDKNGKFTWKQQKVCLTSSLASCQAGFQGTDKSQLEVWFARFLLGHFDPLNLSFLQTDITPQTPETKEN
jgi:hypothetical protein